jgi:intracellular septation protein A
MSVYERISAVVSLTLIGLALYFVLEFPAQAATVSLFSTPLSLATPRQWLLAVLLAGITMAGTNTVIRAHPRLRTHRLSYLASFWMLPGLLVVLATQTLALAATPLYWGIGLAGIGLLLWFTIFAEYYCITQARWAYLWRQVIGYALALTLFLVIYYTRSRGALSATAVLLVSGMISLSLLRQAPDSMSKTWLFSVVIGVIMGQITWALNYWRASTLSVGLLLLLLFYILTGLAQHYLLHKLSRRSLWEFGTVTIIALLVIYII